ncbi:MAG: CocE/NonD family hydrolase [Actinomycetota bacterium]|nr:CocE/NonD family hydrolase [Actinomycetota bacterium]
MSDGARLAARMERPMFSDDELAPAVLELIPYRQRNLAGS